MTELECVVKQIKPLDGTVVWNTNVYGYRLLPLTLGVEFI
jgi:hypothetical protein